MGRHIFVTDRTGKIFRIMDREKISFKEAEEILLQKEKNKDNNNILDDIDLIEVTL